MKNWSSGWTPIPNAIIRNPGLSFAEKALWCDLLSRANPTRDGDFRCWPSNRDLAATQGCSAKHARATLYRLRDLGFVEVFIETLDSGRERRVLRVVHELKGLESMEERLATLE